MTAAVSSQYKLLIFDWDGTLMDSEARIVNSLRHASKEVLGIDKTDDQFKNVIGLGLREALQVLHPEIKDSEIQKMAESYKKIYLSDDNIPSNLFEGVENLLSRLKDTGYKLAVATGKGREGLDLVLKNTGLNDHFHITKCATETRSKPHPQMLHEILDELEIHPDHSLMIGDTEYDMEMALNAGIDRLAVSYGVHAEERLLNHNPIGCIHNILELPEYLNPAFR